MKPSRRNLANAALRAEKRAEGAPTMSRYAAKCAALRSVGRNTQEGPAYALR